MTTWLSPPATRGLVVLGSLGLGVGGGTLVAAPLRAGLTAHSVVVAGVGALLLVLAVACARLRLRFGGDA